MNQSLSLRRSSMDYLHPSSRRFSMGIGVGKDSLILPKEFGGEGSGNSNDDNDWTNLKQEAKSNVQESVASIQMKKAKRRRSSFGGLSALMAEDVKISGSRRHSLASNLSLADSMSFMMDDSYMGFERYGTMNQRPHQRRSSHGMTTPSPSTKAEKQVQSTPTIRFDPTIDLPTLKTRVEDFASAMDSTSKSQQDIHDWDRKMGLKRSHSKTMRLSMRSRKKLRAIMKKELTTLTKAAGAKSDKTTQDDKE
ncbi:MAG: hypothetical protein SGARI_003138 [Bacillariaceae sp.]